MQAVASLKLAMLPLALAYLHVPPELLSDVAATAFTALHWLASGLVNAWSYMLVPAFVPEPSCAARAGGLMSVVFQGGTVLGLVCAALVERFWACRGMAETPDGAAS